MTIRQRKFEEFKSIYLKKLPKIKMSVNKLFAINNFKILNTHEQVEIINEVMKKNDINNGLNKSSSDWCARFCDMIYLGCMAFTGKSEMECLWDYFNCLSDCFPIISPN
jgi:hypothetical protein